jgi:hypothetical protein
MKYETQQLHRKLKVSFLPSARFSSIIFHLFAKGSDSGEASHFFIQKESFVFIGVPRVRRYILKYKKNSKEFINGM